LPQHLFFQLPSINRYFDDASGSDSRGRFAASPMNSGSPAAARVSRWESFGRITGFLSCPGDFLL
jgi:hypothetical protein